MNVNGKVIVITGAGRGIGKAAAKTLAEKGAKVVACDRDFEAVQGVEQEIKAAGGEAVGMMVDVTNRTQIDEMVNTTVEKFGRIDVLINNAGITQDSTLVKMTPEQFDRVIDINLKGVFHCTQAVVPQMIKQGKGKIINTSSVVGLYGNFGQTNYVATKAGVIGMTKTWAKELARKGITSNAVAPGFIATEMAAAVPEKVIDAMKEKTPVGRLGDPADIANAYLFLSSDASDYINGHVLSVDGGLTI
ncbi:MAG: 3-oxoacyl-[acyl-carrier-protein] reductase [Bacteroidota bacterium]